MLGTWPALKIYTIKPDCRNTYLGAVHYCARGGLDWIFRKMSLQEKLQSIGMECSEWWWSYHPWSVQKTWMWHLETWSSGEYSGAGLMIAFDDLKGVFQH